MFEVVRAAFLVLAFFVGLYLLVLLVVWLGQERFIFQAQRLPSGHTFLFEEPFEELSIPTADGETLSALFFPATGMPRGAVLYFHGNRGNLSRWGNMHHPFTQRGYDVLMIDYRGYGKSTGTPSEAGLYQDAEAALQSLLRRHPLQDVIFYGRSLGSGVAAHLATQYGPRALIMETPYDAMPNVIQHQVRVPLLQSLFRHHFPNHRYLPRLNCPVYIFAGSHDRLIPEHLSRRLQPLLSDPAHFYLIEGASHHNIPAFKAYHFQLDCLLLP